MPTESFGIDDFAKVLEDAGYQYDKLGYISGEYCFAVDLGKQVSIRIRSSIHLNGHAAESGSDSIRLWLAYQGQSLSAKGVPTGINERYIQRIAGWQERLVTQIEKLRFFRTVLGDCQCGYPRIALISHTAKNPGRVFTKCVKCEKWGMWLDTDMILKQAVLPFVEPNKFTPMKSDKNAEGQNLFGSTSGNGSNSNGHAAGGSNCLDAHDNSTQPVEPVSTVSLGDDSLMTGLSFLSDVSALAVEPDEPKPAKAFTPSPFQEAIRDFVLNDSRHLRIEAYAGCAKTSTNAWVCGFIPRHSMNVKQMVFAKANQLDMEKKIPDWIPATTTHSAGFADIRRAWGNNIKVDDRKVWSLLKTTYAENWIVRDVAPSIVKLVSLCKNTLREPNKTNLDYLTERFDIETNGSADIIYDVTRTLYHKSLEMRNVIDFDDMLFIPAAGYVPVERCDLLFVDEYQDNNDAQKEYYLKTQARIIFVGDAYQAIYGFRGAMIGAMDDMQAILSAEQLPLPVSYRCAKSIIAKAQTIVPGILARDNAPDGLVKTIMSLNDVRAGDMVLCRNNAPLVKPCFEMIRQGRKATIKGRDIGKGLVTFIKKIEKRFGSDNLRRFLCDMQQYAEDEAGKLDVVGKEAQAAKLRDDSETVLALSDGCQTVRDIQIKIDGDYERGIKGIFSDDVEGITFSTGHKAKGLESERVFVIKPELLRPQKYDKKAWQLEQLEHLDYVITTRAKNELYYVQGVA